MSILKDEKEIAELIRDCLAQKRKAQHKLFKSYYSSMMNVCLRYANGSDEAQDMLNEGFIKIFANLDKYKNTGSFEAWMRRVMANASLDFQRKYHSDIQSVPFETLQEAEFAKATHNDALNNLSYNELMLCIQKLPAMSKNVFNLYVFEAYNHAEIAEMLNIKEGTSHWHLNFARNKLKEEITRINKLI